jgi:hypothetical protein
VEISFKDDVTVILLPQCLFILGFLKLLVIERKEKKRKWVEWDGMLMLSPPFKCFAKTFCDAFSIIFLKGLAAEELTDISAFKFRKLAMKCGRRGRWRGKVRPPIPPSYQIFNDDVSFFPLFIYFVHGSKRELRSF